MSDALVEARDGILIITINRPDAKNAMNKQASELIAAALDRLDAENDLRVGIVTGAGGTFCSGMDLKGFLRGETPFVAGRGFGGITQKSPAKPLIAAVDGYALAGGLEVAIACDMIVANDVGTHAMGGARNRVTIVSHAGAEPWPELDKHEVAERLARLIADRLGSG